MTQIAIPGLKLHVEEHGEGEPVLLLHGLGSSGEDWSEVVPALAKRFRVIVPDVRGHGQSEKPPGTYSVPLFAADIAALCAALDVKRAHVVGLSMGGMIAFQLAVSRPELVASLSILNSGPDMVPRNLRTKFLLGLRVFILKAFGSATLAKMLVKKLFPKPEHAHKRDALERRMASNDRDVYLRCTQALIGWTVIDRLAEIRCPVLVLAAEHDYTPVQMKRDYAAKLPDARVEIIADSGHASPGDQPEKVVEALLGFFDSQARFRKAARG